MSNTELGYGDLLSFQTASGCFMEAQGVLDNEVVIAQEAQSYEETLFRICVRTRVSAAEELAEYDEEFGHKDPTQLKDSEKERFQTLERVKAKEAEMNLRTMDESWGMPVKYGEVVQFQHVSTGKWLTVMHSETANVEPENFSIALQTDAATQSWFSLKPAAAFQREGDIVSDTQEIIIESANNPAEKLHVSKAQLNKRNPIKSLNDKKLNLHFYELNCSLDVTFFKVCRFASYQKPSTTVQIGDLVMLKDPRTKGHMGPSKAGLVSLDTSYVFKKSVSSEHVWRVEGEDVTPLGTVGTRIGGEVGWNQCFRLRHLNTGRYIQVTRESVKAASENVEDLMKAAREDADNSIVSIDMPTPSKDKNPEARPMTAATLLTFSLGKLTNANLDKTLLAFDVVPGVNPSDSDFVTDRGVALLGAELKNRDDIMYCGCHADATRGPPRGHALFVTDSNDKAVPLVLEKVATCAVTEDYETDLQIGTSALVLMQPFVEWLATQMNSDSFEEMLASFHPTIKDVFSQLLAFTVEDPNKMESHNITPIKHHQQLMREQGVLDMLLDILELCTKFRESNTLSASAIGEDGVIHVLECECFSLLRVCIMKSNVEQEHVADRFSVFLAYVGNNDVANDCVTVLLDNRLIQEQKVGEKEMEAFIDILRKSNLNASILDVLAALCSCQGVPMEYSQTELAEILLQGGPEGGGHAKEQLLVEFVRSGSSGDSSIRLLFPNEKTPITLPELKDAKQKFFSAQIYLMAEICYDRNYKAIGILQNHITFDTLCVAISDVSLNPNVRSGLVKLVTSLYVDCQPQQKHRIKNLSFCWSAIPIGTNNKVTGSFKIDPDNRPSTPSRPKGRALSPSKANGEIQMQQKGLFEKLKVDIKNELAKAKWSAFTEHAVGLLFKLIDFKFYHNSPKDLQEVVNTLLKRLDTQVKADSESSENQTKSRKQSLAVTEVEEDPSCLEKYTGTKAKKHLLKFLDSIGVMTFILLLVFAAVTVGLAFTPTPEIEIFDNITYVIFLTELLLRMWAMGLKDFFFGPNWHFCMVDLMVVFLDSLTLVMAATGGTGPGGGAKIARTIRMLRMLRLLKARKALIAIRAALNKPPDVPPWKLGERFKYPESTMVKAMTQMVSVLKQATHIVHRYRLVSLLGSLKQSHTTSSTARTGLGGSKRNLLANHDETQLVIDPESTFEHSLFTDCLKANQQLVVGSKGVEIHKVCFHLVLYESPALVQEAIELLMAYFGRSVQLSDDVCNVQLLMHADLEASYATLQAKLDYVSNMLDNYESFCSMASEADVATSQQVLQALHDIEAKCLNVIAPDDEKSVKEYMMGTTATKTNFNSQTMLRNLYLTETYLKWRDNVSVSTQANHGSELEIQHSRQIRKACNSLMCAYICKNPTNQEQMFRYLELLMDDLGDDVGAASVIAEILRENEKVIKLIPPTLILQTVECIVENGRDPALLEVLLVTQRIGPVAIRANQLLVTQHLTNTDVMACTMYIENDCIHQVYKDIMLRQLMAQRDGATSVEVMSVDAEHGAIGSIPSPGKSVPAAGAAAARSRVLGSTTSNMLLDNFRHARAGVANELHHLDTELQYHIALSRLLASCADGAIHIVESKVQSLFSINTMLNGLMSDGIIMDIKISLSRLFYDAVVDVQVPVPDLEINHLMWRYLATFLDDLKAVEQVFTKNGKEGGVFFYPGAAEGRGHDVRPLMRYCFECVIPIITDFFKCYYDVSKMHRMAETSDEAGDNFNYMKLPNQLFHRVIDLYTSNPKELLPEHRHMLYTCSLELMSYKDRRFSNMGLSEEHEDVDEDDDDYKRRMKEKAVAGEAFAAAGSAEAAAVHWKRQHDEQNKPQDSLPTPQRMTELSLVGEVEQEKELHEQLNESFRNKTDALVTTPEVKESCHNDLISLIDLIENIPRTLDKVVGDLRYEVLIAKLIRHTSDQIKVDGDRKSLVPDSTTAVWIIRLFRQMIEHRWGFGIEDRDEEGDDDSDEKVAEIQDVLDDSGATRLCLDLFAKGMDTDVKEEALSLLVALLYREGGNVKVQQTMYECLAEGGSEFFFAEVIVSLDNVEQFYEDELKFEFDEEEDPETPAGGMLLLRVLQLMCEGHFADNQDIMREQPNNKVSVNLLEAYVFHFNKLAKVRNRSALAVVIALEDVMLEIVQGPCKGNQDAFALESELLEGINRSMRLMTEPLDEECDITEDEQEDAIECMLKIIKALLEGQIKDSHGKNMIYERILSVVHLEMLSMMLNPPEVEMTDDVENLEAAMAAREKAENAPLKAMQVEALVVIQTLMVYNDALAEDMDFSDSVVKKMGSEVVSVEVVWKGELQKKQFKAPDLCKHLVKATRANLVSNVDRDNFDSQMNDFIERCNGILCELKHHQFMDEIGLAGIFSRPNQERATTVTFIINLIINFIYLFFMELPGKIESHAGMASETGMNMKEQLEYYPTTATNNGEKWLNSDHALSNVPVWVRTSHGRNACREGFNISMFCWSWDTGLIVTICNVAQITLSFFTLVLFVVVRAPVEYKATMQETGSMKSSILAVLTRTSTLYYVGYLAFAVLGRDYPLFNAVLLLDILMKSPTCADVCNSVVHPFKQLLTTVVLMLFTMFIFTFIFFDQYHDHFKYGECNTMLRCSLVMLNFGMRNGGGLADYMYDEAIGPVNELGPRYMADFLYFVIVLIILLNIVFGIIIDTFSELRDNKNERADQTENFCFICGIEKNKFEQLGPGGFEAHIQTGGDHSMWSYLQFIIFIADQDEDDDDGLESYIRECLDSHNLDWLPHNKAISMLEYGDDEETVEEKAGKLVRNMKLDFMTQLASVKTEAEEKHKAAITSLSEASRKLEAQVSDQSGKIGLNAMVKMKMRAKQATQRMSSFRTKSRPSMNAKMMPDPMNE